VNGDAPTVLVLGAGGNVSQGVLKALALARLQCRVVAGCVSPLSAGLHLAERALVGPYADDPAFPGWVAQACADEGVDVVLSGVEPVLEALAATSLPAIVSEPGTLALGADKLATAHWLAEQGFAAPRSADAADADAVAGLVRDCGLPLVAKPRVGKGSEGVVAVEDEHSLERVAGAEGVVLQEHLDGEEFTVGCVCDRDGELRGSLAMRRELQAGTTYRAEAGDFPVVREEAERIARRLRPRGPLNVQLRLRDGRPVAFELNVRFSGTTPMRARLGFNEVEACIRHFVLGEPLELPMGAEGTVLRYWNEVYVRDEAVERLREQGSADAPGGSVEDWGMRR
jgi:carbamoyl-phosphate synthase large subunit